MKAKYANVQPATRKLHNRQVNRRVAPPSVTVASCGTLEHTARQG